MNKHKPPFSGGAKRLASSTTWRTSILACIFLAAATALGNPTPEDVSRSLNQSLDQPVDMSKAVPYLLSILGFLILVILYHFHRKRKETPRTLNNPGKLSREICRAISLRPAELRQLKILAEQQELEHPLTLILCPSALGKAIRTPAARVDRAVLKQIVLRLKRGLAQ